MALGWSLLVQRSLAVIFFRLFRLVFIAVQRVYWELNGTARQVREASDPRYYDRSAQVLDVVKEVHFCEMPTHGMEEFICVHNRFENPQFVIDNEHITLYTITNSHAVFGVAKEKGNWAKNRFELRLHSPFPQVFKLNMPSIDLYRA